MKLGPYHHVPEPRCHECGVRFGGAACVNGNLRPKPDDYSLCIYCGALGVFTADLQIRKPTDDEIREVAGDRDLVAASKALAELHKNPAENAALPGVLEPKKPG